VWARRRLEKIQTQQTRTPKRTPSTNSAHTNTNVPTQAASAATAPQTPLTISANTHTTAASKPSPLKLTNDEDTDDVNKLSFKQRVEREIRLSSASVDSNDSTNTHTSASAGPGNTHTMHRTPSLDDGDQHNFPDSGEHTNSEAINQFYSNSTQQPQASQQAQTNTQTQQTPQQPQQQQAKQQQQVLPPKQPSKQQQTASILNDDSIDSFVVAHDSRMFDSFLGDEQAHTSALAQKKSSSNKQLHQQQQQQEHTRSAGGDSDSDNEHAASKQPKKTSPRGLRRAVSRKPPPAPAPAPVPAPAPTPAVHTYTELSETAQSAALQHIQQDSPGIAGAHTYVEDPVQTPTNVPVNAETASYDQQQHQLAADTYTQPDAESYAQPDTETSTQTYTQAGASATAADDTTVNYDDDIVMPKPQLSPKKTNNKNSDDEDDELTFGGKKHTSPTTPLRAATKPAGLRRAGKKQTQTQADTQATVQTPEIEAVVEPRPTEDQEAAPVVDTNAIPITPTVESEPVPVAITITETPASVSHSGEGGGDGDGELTAEDFVYDVCTPSPTIPEAQTAATSEEAETQASTAEQQQAQQLEQQQQVQRALVVDTDVRGDSVHSHHGAAAVPTAAATATTTTQAEPRKPTDVGDSLHVSSADSCSSSEFDLYADNVADRVASTDDGDLEAPVHTQIQPEGSVPVQTPLRTPTPERQQLPSVTAQSTIDERNETPTSDINEPSIAVSAHEDAIHTVDTPVSEQASDHLSVSDTITITPASALTPMRTPTEPHSLTHTPVSPHTPPIGAITPMSPVSNVGKSSVTAPSAAAVVKVTAEHSLYAYISSDDESYNTSKCATAKAAPAAATIATGTNSENSTNSNPSTILNTATTSNSGAIRPAPTPSPPPAVRVVPVVPPTQAPTQAPASATSSTDTKKMTAPGPAAPVVRRKKQADAAPVGSKQASKSRLSMRKLGDDDEDDDDNDNTIGGGSGIKSKFVDLDEDEDDAVASKQVKRASVTQKHAVAGALM
jgi:hypothetical protein